MIDIHDVRKLAELARLSISEEQIQSYQKDFEGILDYIGVITSASVDTTVMTPPSVLGNVVREDTLAYEPGVFTEYILANAPRVTDGYIEVPKIL